MGNPFCSVDKETLYITHSSGFFANCTISLFCIVQYYNNFKKLPTHVDFSKTFSSFKDNYDHDIFGEYFSIKDTEIPYKNNIHMNWHSLFNYSEEPYNDLAPFVEKYFYPTMEVQSISESISEKYEIDYRNTLVICYRGTDKYLDTGLGTYEEYLEKARACLLDNPGMKVLVQTDQGQFLDLCYKELASVFHIEELPVTKSNIAMHDIIARNDKIVWTKNFLGVIFLISKCKYIINHSGNVARWICLYRGSAEGSVQYLRPKEIELANPGSYWIT